MSLEIILFNSRLNAKMLRPSWEITGPMVMKSDLEQRLVSKTPKSSVLPLLQTHTLFHTLKETLCFLIETNILGKPGVFVVSVGFVVG